MRVVRSGSCHINQDLNLGLCQLCDAVDLLRRGQIQHFCDRDNLLCDNLVGDKENQTCDKEIKSLVANLEASANDNLDYSGNLLVWRQPVHRL